MSKNKIAELEAVVLKGFPKSKENCLPNDWRARVMQDIHIRMPKSIEANDSLDNLIKPVLVWRIALASIVISFTILSSMYFSISTDKGENDFSFQPNYDSYMEIIDQ